MKSNYSELGKYIREVNERNSNLTITNLLGVSMEKTFIPSVANLNGVDLSIYKILRKDQLACKLMSVGRDEKLPVDLYREQKPSIVSSAYYVFEPQNKDELLPEYLMMWLCRPENDRYIGFISGGDVRGGISWESFCSLPIKVPSVLKQREIVKEYNTIQNRMVLNQQLIQKLEETAETIYKSWFVEFEFPDENGDPYKSNGGEMVFNEELQKEIPKGWEVKPFTKIVKLSGGGTPDTNIGEFWNGEIPFFTPGDVVDSYYTIRTEKYVTEKGFKNSSTKLYPKDTVFVTARGTVGAISISGCEMTMNQSCYAITGKNGINQYFSHQLTLSAIEKLKNEALGAVFAALVTKDFESQILIEPDKNSIKLYGMKIKPFYNYILTVVKENQKLTELKDLLLSKLATIEN